jgi:putative FmdB family regulatory protein
MWSVRSIKIVAGARGLCAGSSARDLRRVGRAGPRLTRPALPFGLATAASFCISLRWDSVPIARSAAIPQGSAFAADLCSAVFKPIARKERFVMATYEFKCTECKKAFSVKQTFPQHDHHARVKCPQCGSTNVKQQIAHVFAHTAKKS